jgi:hypothetical protein
MFPLPKLNTKKSEDKSLPIDWHPAPCQLLSFYSSNTMNPMLVPNQHHPVLSKTPEPISLTCEAVGEFDPLNLDFFSLEPTVEESLCQISDVLEENVEGVFGTCPHEHQQRQQKDQIFKQFHLLHKYLDTATPIAVASTNSTEADTFSRKRTLDECASSCDDGRQGQTMKRQRNNFDMATDMSLRPYMSSSRDTDLATDDNAGKRFRQYQAEQWSEKFEELIQFKKVHGHCCVPHTFKPNAGLARWVKRQRYQYKLWLEEKSYSTITQARVDVLEQLGFVWDSHNAAWETRYSELCDYKKVHGNTNVPSNYRKFKLAAWVKCQRRQYKTFRGGDSEGKKTHLSLERIHRLETLGFEWELRFRTKQT